MPRIRSVHPGQWTDEDFVGCSMAARLLAIAIRNIADDEGVFEWKPVTIKMTVFPADDVNVTELLEELVLSRQVRRYTVDGKAYGIIRNFKKYQRPKKPVSNHPLPNSAEMTAPKSTPEPEPVPDQFPTGGEVSPQRKEEGGSSSSEPNGSAAAAARPMTVYDVGEALLTLDGTTKPASARSLIAKLCKANGDDAVQAAIDAIRSRDPPPADMRSALIAAVATRGKANGRQSVINEGLDIVDRVLAGRS